MRRELATSALHCPLSLPVLALSASDVLIELNCRGCRWEIPETRRARVYAEMCDGAHIRFASESDVSKSSALSAPSLVVGLHGLHGLSRWALPLGISLDGRELISGERHCGYAVLTYGSSDSFKRASSLDDLVFCGVSMRQWLQEREVSAANLWMGWELAEEADGRGIELWTARLHPVLIRDATSPLDRFAQRRFTWLVAGMYSAAAATSSCEGCGSWATEFASCDRISIAQANEESSPICLLYTSPSPRD